MQVVYLDHRGSGRSRGGGGSDPATWTLEQWSDDVAAFCDELGISRPIVYGQSFGGMVAQTYATRHPGHAGALIFSSTAATFDLDETVETFGALGGPGARELAFRFWTRMSGEDLAAYLETCLPLYTYGFGEVIPSSDDLFRPDVLRHFCSAGGEIHRMDLRPGLDAIDVPVLVLTGDRDPVTSPVRAREIHAALPPHARYVEVPSAGHGAYRDQPDHVETVIRSFLSEVIDGPTRTARAS